MGNLYLLLVAFLLLCASCKNTKTDNNDIAEKICLNFIEKDKNLIIPDSLTNLVDGTLFKTYNTCDSGIMLIHTLDIPCGGCVKALDNLSEYFVKLDKNHNIRTIIIASSSYMENEVEKYLFNYPYPILLDSSEIFKIRNKIIRDDILCSFLIENSKVLKVGDLKDQTFREELIDYISKKNHENKKE